MIAQHKRNGGLAMALVLVGAGLLLAETLLVTAGVIPLVYLLYRTVSTVPDDRQLSASRNFDAAGSVPGATVDVELTVENTGDSVLSDIRVIDGVPEELAVVSGSPRNGTALSPGEAMTISYTVVLNRGHFAFDDPVFRLRSMAGTDTVTETVPVEGESSLSAANALSEPPVADDTLTQAGSVPTEKGGPGLEFHATRQYHHGDPMNRIDWHHVAKTGEFVTVQYRQEQKDQTVIIVDCRPCGRVTPQVGYPTGVGMAAYAGERLYHALDRTGVFTTVTAVGLDGELPQLTEPDGLPWIQASGEVEGTPRSLFRGIHSIAGTGADRFPVRPAVEKGETVTNETAAHDGLTKARSDGGSPSWSERLLARLPTDGQVIICTPLLDDWPVEFATELAGREYSSIVVSPDVTTGYSQGKRLAGVLRRQRLRRMERYGVDTVDWPIDQPIEHRLRRALQHYL